MTAHKAQGATVDRAWVLGSDACYREWAYVALSRARAGTRLYLLNPHPTDTGFSDAIQHRRAQQLATDTGIPEQPRADAAPSREPGMRRLQQVEQAIADAHTALDAATDRLHRATAQLAERTSGLRRLTRRTETADLRRDLARHHGDVTAWTDHLDQLSQQTADLLDRHTRDSHTGQGRPPVDRHALEAPAPAHTRSTDSGHTRGTSTSPDPPGHHATCRGGGAFCPALSGRKG
jgi:hypothetical protein